MSIDKHLLDIYGNSTKDNTIISLRMAKEHIASVGGTINVSINKWLLSLVKSARQIFKSDLNTKRKLDQAVHSKENND